jgi:hypothetical protein
MPGSVGQSPRPSIVISSSEQDAVAAKLATQRRRRRTALPPYLDSMASRAGSFTPSERSYRESLELEVTPIAARPSGAVVFATLEV